MRFNFPRFLFWALLIVVGWIALVPLAVLLFTTVSVEHDKMPFEAVTFTLNNYIRLLNDREFLGIIGNTALFSLSSTVFGIGVAIFFAWLIERTDIWCRTALYVAILIPMAIPSMIYGMSWIQLLSPNNGLATVILKDIDLDWLLPSAFSMQVLIMVQSMTLASHSYLLVAAPFRMLDARLEEQSNVCGRRLFGTLRQITLPILKPALLSALVFYIIVALETFDIPVTLGLSSRIYVLSTRIYWLSHPEGGSLPDYGMAATMSIILLGIALCLIALYHRQTRNARQFVTIGGRAGRAQRTRLGGWRLPLFLLALLYVFAAVALPLFMLIWRSLLNFYVFPSPAAFRFLTVDAYRKTFSDADLGGVLWNTVLVAGTAGFVTVGLAALIAWFVLRGPVSRGYRKLLHNIAFLPQAVPSIVIGLAILFVYIFMPLPIYGTVWIIALAMITKLLSFSTGSLVAAQLQISTELEEASQLCGAGWLRTYLRIVVPLLMPALSACFLWVVIHVVRELGLALILYSLNSQVLATKIWLMWQSGAVSQASAISVVTIIVLLLILAAPWAVRRITAVYRRVTARLSLPKPQPAAGR